MGTVNYIKGLYGPIRVGYPLGFSPSGIIDPTTGLALPTTAVIGGAGYSTTYPEISSLASARFLEWNLKTTNTGSGEVYGEYMSLQSGGTGTGYVYTKGALAKSVAGGYVAELGACYYKTQLTAGTVTGQAYVGFFEYVVDTGVANMPSGGILQLDDIVDGSLNAVHGYIAIRTYGGTPFSNLFNIMDHTSGTGKLFYGSTLKMRIGSTLYYLPLSTAENTLTFSGVVSITNATDASSLTAGALVVAGGIACAKQLYLGDDIDMSVSGTGTYDITLKDAVADALSIVRGTTDMMVFDSSTPKITITPDLFLAGNLDFSTAASDIIAKANTAVAIEFYDATTKFVAIDTRNTVSADMVTFTCIPDTITAAAGVTRRVVNIVPGTTTLTGSTGVDDMVGVALLVGRPTITDASAVTVAKASTMCITNAPAAGGSVTITTALALEVAAGKSLFRGDVDFGIDATGWDVTFYGDITAYKVWWDQNGDTNGAWFFGADTKGVQVNLYGDVTGCGVFWDPTTDTNGTLSIGAAGGSKGNDVFMYGATNGNYVQWDQSADDLLLVGTATQLAVAGTAASTTTTSGSLRTAGGLGVVGAAFFGGLVTSNSTTGFRSLPVFVPDSTRTNYALAIGSRITELDVTMAAAADQNLDPMQMNLNIIGVAPTGTSTLNGIYQQITHDTTDMPNLRLKGCDWTITTDKQCMDAYVVQTELIVSGTKTSGGELMAMSALTTLGAGARTADRVLAFQAMISGDGTAGTVVGDCFVAYIVNAGTVITTNSIVNIRNQSAATATSALELELDGTVTYALDLQGTVSDGWTSGDGAIAGSSNEYALIPVRVAGVTPTLYILAAETWS